MKMGGNFMNLAGSVLGDMGSTATLMKDAGRQNLAASSIKLMALYIAQLCSVSLRAA
jgi:phosphotransferase system HPr-like phosphotransfer protein